MIVLIFFETRSCASLFQKICQKYDDLSEVDKLAALTKKVETVKLTMQENIDVALQNCVKLESIEEAAGLNFSLRKLGATTDAYFIEDLQQQAGVFKKNATELKNKMWWKNVKVTCA